jgi:biopolymer transport protein ExbD
VDIPITPMLDMAFNLLTFFVMTFNPTPPEVEFGLNLLPAAPQARPDAAPSQAEVNTADVPAALRTLQISLFAAPDTTLDRVVIGEDTVPQAGVRSRLQELLNNEELPFEQVLILADPTLRYEEIIRFVDILASLKVTKVSFGQLDGGALIAPP